MNNENNLGENRIIRMILDINKIKKIVDIDFLRFKNEYMLNAYVECKK